LGRAKFITYKFKGKKSGSTRVLIAAGQAFNDNNSDVGLRSTELNLVISGDAGSPTPNLQEKVVDVKINVKGDNAFYKQDPYTFTLYHKKEGKHQQAISKIWLFDEGWNVVYENEKLWRTDEDTILNFVIPENTVEKEGNYTIIAKVRYEDGTEKEVAEKYLGVLSNGKTWFTKNSHIFMPFFWATVIISIIHHFFSEREVYFKLHSFLRKSKDKRKK
jgi:hypothetical protein